MQTINDMLPTGDPRLPAVCALVRERLAAARGSHDWEHTERVTRLCLKLGPPEGAAMGILLAAALLHDLGRDEEDRSNGAVCHAALGADLARVVLPPLGYAADEVGHIAECIAAHRFRDATAPATREARVLYDADKLDAIGAVGIGRAFLFAGEIGAKLHDPDCSPDRCAAYGPDDTAYREYLVKLRHISGRLLTESGRALAGERHAFMVAYFDRLNREVAGDA
ncbi:MAG TPA: HD domain-containing protein [bacterium]|nr:HD domain-containing protein [bacterium]